MKFKTAFWIMAIAYGVDCLLLTPHILINKLGVEAGLLCSWGYNLFGIPFFYVWFAIFSTILWFSLKYLFRYYDKRLGNLSDLPKYAMVISWVVLMVGIIGNNLQFV